MKLEDKLMELPNSWNITNIGNVAEIIMGQSPPSDTYNYEKIGLPFFQGKAEFTDLHPTIKKWCSEPNKIALPDDILLSVRAPVGAVNIANVECCIGRGLSAIRYSECPKFLYYFFQFNEKKLDEKGTGTTFRAISGEILKDYPLNLPPTNEQHRIVTKIEALFSELDKGIESFKTAREQLKIYRQALLKHAFSGKLTEQWRAENSDAAQGCANAAGEQEPGAAKLESAEALLQRIQTERQQRYQQQLKDWEANGKPGSKPKPPKNIPPLATEELAKLPELPSEWLKVKVSHLLAEDLCNGKSVKDRQGGFPVLRLNSLIDGKIDLSISKEGDWTEIQAKNYLVKDGDFLVSRGNGSKHLVGRGGIARIQVGRNNFVAFPDTMIRIRLSNSLVYLDYFSFCWDSPVIRNQVEKTARTTAGIYKINQALIEDYVLPLPCLEEQKVISNLLDSSLSNIDQLDQTITTALQQAEALRQAILKKAFSGQLVPQDPNDEPASVLLERIRAEKAQADTQPARRRGKTA